VSTALAPVPLKAGADCTISIASSVTDKDGNSVTTTGLTFHTEDFQVVETSPGDAENVPADGFALAITFNTAIDAATATDQNVHVHLASAPTVDLPGTVSLDSDASLVWTPTGTLAAGQDYTATVDSGATGVTDTFGATLSADFTTTFSTDP